MSVPAPHAARTVRCHPGGRVPVPPFAVTWARYCSLLGARPPKPRGAMPPHQLPAVSVIMPVLNEERHLRNSVRHILEQEYDGEMEVVIAVGPSTDRTEEIAAQLASEDPRVNTVPNPTGRTPAALNAAIKAARPPLRGGAG